MYINRTFEFEPTGRRSGYFWEPLTTIAPSEARPYCCYIATVIFHKLPYEVTPDRGYAEYDRVETQWDLLGERWTSRDLGWASLAPFVWHDGVLYELAPGRVVYRDGRWWMRHGAYRVPRDDHRLRYLEVPYWTMDTRR